jgi:cytidylate kinase
MVRKLDDLCIAISGSHGTGTSTTGEKLAERLGLRFVSAGVVFREFAKERGDSIKNFTHIVESDPYLKEELDKHIELEAQQGGVVVEGRMVAWTAEENAHLRIMLRAPFDVRVERIAKRDEKSITRASEETRKREREEKEWFYHHFQVDIEDTTIYNLIIDSSRFNSNAIVALILAALDQLGWDVSMG